MSRPIPKNIGHHCKRTIRNLSPEDKLDLYNFGDAPLRLGQKEARELRSATTQIFYEHFNSSNYEGRYGASPREVRMMILNAAQDPRYDHLSVGAIFDQIEHLIEEKTSYDFLRREPVRGYRDAEYLLHAVKRHYISLLEDEVRNALGFYSKESYLELFTRYVMHVSAWIKKVRVFDPLFQREIDADEQFMTTIEQKLLAHNEAKDDFRRQLIGHIGASEIRKS